MINIPPTVQKIEIIEELTKECLKDSEDEDGDKTQTMEEPLNDEEIYEYLIDKVGGNNHGSSNNTQSTSFVHLPQGGRGGDVRIRVNTTGFSRLRSVFNRRHF